jgi:TPR repeat protein
LEKGFCVPVDCTVLLVQRSTKLAASCYRLAASQGHPAAMNNFGGSMEYGQNIEANPIQAAITLIADRMNITKR